MTFSALRRISNSILYLKWQFVSSNSTEQKKINAHILVVQKTDYIELAKICSTSFLHYHPNALITLHADENVHKELLSGLKRNRFYKSGHIRVLLDQDSGQLNWQKSKMDLILSLNGTRDLIMDADLRWNGKLHELTSPTFFVNEFRMLDRSPYRQLLQSYNVLNENDIWMRNISFFTFMGKTLTKNEINSVLEFFSKYEAFLSGANIGADDIFHLRRLSEQITFSIVLPQFFQTIDSLKTADGHKDGKFVESSYFGATGSRF